MVSCVCVGDFFVFLCVFILWVCLRGLNRGKQDGGRGVGKEDRG